MIPHLFRNQSQRLGRWLDYFLLCAALLAVAGALMGSLRRNTQRGQFPSTTVHERDWRVLQRESRYLGSSTAPIVVVEFIDYECRYCAAAEHVFSGLDAEYPGRIRRFLKHFPSPSRANAIAAALALECAFKNGKLAEAHTNIFAAQDSLSVVSWQQFPNLIGIDTAAFSSCWADESTKRVVHDNIKLGERLGVSGTPTFIINSQLFERISSAALRAILVSKIHSAD